MRWSGEVSGIGPHERRAWMSSNRSSEGWRVAARRGDLAAPGVFLLGEPESGTDRGHGGRRKAGTGYGAAGAAAGGAVG